MPGHECARSSGQRLVAQTAIDAEPRAEQVHEVAGEQGDVRAPLPQARKMHADGAEAIVEVLAEQPLSDHAGQVAVRGGEHAHVDADLARAAHVPEGRGIEHPKQRDLRGGAHLADFVQEDRAAGCHLEEARLGAIGAGEGSALVAEQLALQQALLERGAFHGDERAGPPRAAGVDELRGHFLAGARLAGDEHGGVCLRHALEQPEDAAELGAFTDEGRAEIGRREPALQQAGAVPQRLPLEGPLNADLEFIERTGFRDVVEGPDAYGLNRAVDGPVPGQHHDFAWRLALPQGLQHVEPAHSGQLEVEQDDLGLGQRAGGERLFAARRRADVVARAGELGRHHGPERRVIVDQQQQRLCGHHAVLASIAVAAGSSTSKVDPRPRVLSTRMSPPQRRTELSDRNRPRPVPPFLRLKKGSKMRF